MSTAVDAAPARPGTSRPRPAPLGRRLRRGSTPYLFVLPFFLVFAGFSLYPLLYSLRLSLTNWHGAGAAAWVGLANYRYLLTNSEFWHSLANSGVIWLFVLPAQIVLGLALSVVLADARLKLRAAYRIAFIAPFVTPLVAMAQIWVVLFDTHFGLVNHLLSAVGLPGVGWLTSTGGSKPTIALLLLWKTTGFVVILMLAGLQNVPTDVYEAAAIDGAGRFRRFVSITIPLMRRTIAFAVVVQTLAVFQLFAEPYILTQGGPYQSSETAGLYLYDHITNGDLGTGAANSFLLVVLVFVLSLLATRLLRPKD